MSARQWMNENPFISTVVAIVLLACCLGFMVFYMNSGPKRGLDAQYYYDTNTRKVTTAEPNGRLAPIDTGSSPSSGQPGGLRVFIYQCGECADYTGMSLDQVTQSGAVVGMLQKYPDEIRKMAKDGNLSRLQGNPLNYRIVRSAEAEQWLKVTSKVGRQIERSARPECEGDKRAQLCLP